jgi:hypothetical protein
MVGIGRWMSFVLTALRQKWGLRSANDKVKRFMTKREEIEARNIDRFGGEPFDPRFIEVCSYHPLVVIIIHHHFNHIIYSYVLNRWNVS